MEIKEQKLQKRVPWKKQLKFEDQKQCLEKAQLENEIKQTQKNKLNVNSLQEIRKEFIKNKNRILKSQQIFRSGKHHIFTEEVNKTALSTNENQRKQSINSIKAHAYGTNEEIIHKKEETKFNNEIDQCKNDYLIIYKKILIIGGSESGKTNALLNLINHEL